MKKEENLYPYRIFSYFIYVITKLGNELILQATPSSVSLTGNTY